MLLEMNSVKKSFRDSDGELPVLKDVNLSLATGESIALTGESGSGKSTLLNIAAGLETADNGTVIIDGQEINSVKEVERARFRRQELAIIFQQFNLIPSMTVADNIAFHARLANRYDPELASQMTAQMGLADHVKKYPETLSSGQQQRVAILRALVGKPRLLLADEPTGNLDEATADQVMRQVLDLTGEIEAGFLIVTHSAKVAAMMGRQVHLENGVLK